MLPIRSVIISSANFISQEISFRFFQSVVSVILIVVWLFIYCHFGQMITDQCADVDKMAYNSLYYLYPLKLRQFTLLTIAQSRKPFYFTGFKMMKCSMESFTRVSMTSFIIHFNMITILFFLSLPPKSAPQFGRLCIHGVSEIRIKLFLIFNWIFFILQKLKLSFCTVYFHICLKS